MTAGGAGAGTAADTAERETRPMSLTVVVCAYTFARWSDLVDNVDAVRRQLRDGDEVVLVVDHNDLLEDAARAAFADAPAVVVVPSSGHRGLSGARNTGIERAQGAIVAFVDDDAVIEPGWVAALVPHYARDGVAAVGGRAEPAWPSSGRPFWFPPEFDWVVGCSHAGTPTETGVVRNLLGATMSFRRSTLDAIGGFRGELGRVGGVPLGCEETELCIRLSRARPGASVVFDPDVRVRHRVTPDRARWRYFVRRCFGEGLSKYRVATTVGAHAALGDERRYVARILPRAIVGGLLGCREHGVVRAGTILCGLVVTTSGYLYAWAGASAERRIRETA